MTDKDNNNLLWSGESVFCECGHHIEYHKTGIAYAVFWKNKFYAHCNFKDKENGQQRLDDDNILLLVGNLDIVGLNTNIQVISTPNA